jgi:hypothetical protein
MEPHPKRVAATVYGRHRRRRLVARRQAVILRRQQDSRMLRPIALTGLVLTALSVVPAFAQEASYCSGAIVAERFATNVVPGPGGRASYSVLLRNTRGQNQNFQLVVTGSFLGRPPAAPRTLRPGGTTNIALGYSPNLPGVPPLRGDQLAQVTRVACL